MIALPSYIPNSGQESEMMTSHFSAGGLEAVNCWIEDGKAACSGHPMRTRDRQRQEVIKDIQHSLERHQYKMEQLQEWLTLAEAGKWSDAHPKDGEMLPERTWDE